MKILKKIIKKLKEILCGKKRDLTWERFNELEQKKTFKKGEF